MPGRLAIRQTLSLLVLSIRCQALIVYVLRRHDVKTGYQLCDKVHPPAKALPSGPSGRISGTGSGS